MQLRMRRAVRIKSLWTRGARRAKYFTNKTRGADLRFCVFSFLFYITLFNVVCNIALAAPIDSTTLYGKMIVGYQGWFNCPNDGANIGWGHWGVTRNDATVDFLPDVSEIPPSELCDSGWTAKDGKHINLFSDQNPAIVDLQLQWMEQYGIDTMALQRFAGMLLNPAVKKSRDKVLSNVRVGACQHGRTWFLMYDLSGMPPDKFGLMVEDWKAQIASGAIAEKCYQYHRGKPVLGLWGLGFLKRSMTPHDIDKLITDLQAASIGLHGVTILAGVPARWREGNGDASPDIGWKSIWSRIDIISPWTVGRYRNDAGADSYVKWGLAPDLAQTKIMGVDYLPVVFPGFSWANLMHATQSRTPAIFDEMPRHCGAFYDRQIINAIHAGARMMYTAMYDEVNEGTAIFKLAVKPSETPTQPHFLTVDEDGCKGGSDLYLKLAGSAAKALSKYGK